MCFDSNAKQADITIKMFKPVGKILKTLNDLTTENVEKLKIEVIPDIEIGSIAGNINNLLLGRLLRNDNDGRIEVDSAIIEGMKDSIVLPYGHKEIHYKYETSILINRFIRKGTFR